MKYCFAADRTLGKLVKWMRILGFDTIFESNFSSESFYENLAQERVLLTRIAKIRNRFATQRLVFIKEDEIIAQLRQVIGELAITPQDLRVFSICLRCNAPKIEIGKPDIYGLVPDYIWQTHDKFSICHQCERIFWCGSHLQRSWEVIEQLFEIRSL